MGLSRVKQLLLNTETEDQLRSCQLSDFLPYLKSPLELIVRIYQDKSAEAFANSGTKRLIDFRSP